jgi:hypothetical protein
MTNYLVNLFINTVHNNGLVNGTAYTLLPNLNFHHC